MRLTAPLLVVMLACSGVPAFGAEKTDVLVLNNGDRITGEILNLNRGRIELKTDHSGTIEVEWDKVVSVESPHRFTVTTANGTILIGTLERPGTRGTVRLGGEGGERVLPIEEITGIEPLGRSFWAKLTGSVGAGFTYTRSSGISQLTFNSGTTYRRPAFQASLNGSATLTSQSDEGGLERLGRQRPVLLRAISRPALVHRRPRQMETNRSLGSTCAPRAEGWSARASSTPTAHSCKSAPGSWERRAWCRRGLDAEHRGARRPEESYYTYDRPKTNVDVTIQYFPSLSGLGRQRFQLTSAVKRELWKDFYVGLNVYDTFDSAPPNAGAFRNDVGITTSISWSFGS
jgi:hypothetical protein